MDSVIKRVGTTGRSYSTWAEELSCSPEVYFEPETYADVQQIIQAASANCKTVRVIGRGHSLNRQALTSGYLLSLKKLNKVVKVDKDKCQVKVEAGAMIKDLNEDILPEHGLAFSIIPHIGTITVGGIFSTGVHGSGKDHMGLSNYIVAMEIVLASGEIIEISQTTNTDLFPAARVSLGVLGIILNVTIQCEPAFTLHSRDYMAATTKVLQNLESFVGYTDHFSLRIQADTNFQQAICSHASRNEQVMQSLPYDDGALINKSSDRSDKILISKSDHSRSDITYIMEWTFSRNIVKDVIEAFLEALNVLNVKMGPGSIILTRFAREDDLYLSPASNQDVGYVLLIILKSPDLDRPSLKAKLDPVLLPIVAKYKGRPIWSQCYDITSVDYSQLYPKWQKFVDARQRLDPNGMFLNVELKKIFLQE